MLNVSSFISIVKDIRIDSRNYMLDVYGFMLIALSFMLNVYDFMLDVSSFMLNVEDILLIIEDYMFGFFKKVVKLSGFQQMCFLYFIFSEHFKCRYDTDYSNNKHWNMLCNV